MIMKSHQIPLNSIKIPTVSIESSISATMAPLFFVITGFMGPNGFRKRFLNGQITKK